MSALIKQSTKRKKGVLADVEEHAAQRTVISSLLPVTIEAVREGDRSIICSWVTNSDALRMISSDQGETLEEDLLQKWCAQSLEAITIRYNSRPVGFCTLSRSEQSLPENHVELCHFVIAPEYRRRYFGTVLLHYMRLLAGHRGFKALHGRVVPGNNAGRSFARYVHWRVEDPLDNRFMWFAYEIRSLLQQ